MYHDDTYRLRRHFSNITIKMSKFENLNKDGVVFQLGNRGIKERDIFNMFTDVRVKLDVEQEQKNPDETTTKEYSFLNTVKYYLKQQDFFPKKTNVSSATIILLQTQKDLLQRLRDIYQEENQKIISGHPDLSAWKRLNLLNTRIVALSAITQGYDIYIREFNDILLQNLQHVSSTQTGD